VVQFVTNATEKNAADAGGLSRRLARPDAHKDALRTAAAFLNSCLGSMALCLLSPDRNKTVVVELGRESRRSGRAVLKGAAHRRVVCSQQSRSERSGCMRLGFVLAHSSLPGWRLLPAELPEAFFGDARFKLSVGRSAEI
jgi:hypothetical protein